MAFARILLRFHWKNCNSGKVYGITLTRRADGSIDGAAQLLGVNSTDSTPLLGTTKVPFVVLARKVAEVVSQPVAHLWDAEIFHDRDRSAVAGVKLSHLFP